jgi:hypothetical protein
MSLELLVEWWRIDEVRPHERNLRKIPQRAIDKVAASIKEFGWRQPIVVDPAGVIVVGRVRYLASQKLGLDEVPVHVAANLTPEQVRAYRLMDNRSHEETGWDLDLLKLEICELEVLSFDLKFTGFEPREIDEFLTSNADEAANQAPPVPTKPISRSGDLWRCGPHRVFHGDATKDEDVARALGDLRPVLMNSDGPYGVSLNPTWREEAGLGTTVQTGKVANDDRVDWSAAHRLFPGDVAYIWHAGVHSGPVAAGIHESVSRFGHRSFGPNRISC